MRRPQTQTPAGRRGLGKTQITSRGTNYTPLTARAKTSEPVDRNNLSHPLDYYTRVLGRFRQINHAGWAQAHCPFHEDRHASLSVRLSGRGNWRCFAGCGSGDLISFHMRRTGLNFAAALRDLERRS